MNSAGNMKNILLLSSGRRVSLAREFKDIAVKSGLEFYTGDADPNMSAACRSVGNPIRLPHCLSLEYVGILSDICSRYRIGMVVPTIDTELQILSMVRDSFAQKGTEIVVCDEGFVRVAGDKRITAQYFLEKGIQSPEIYEHERVVLPALAKPHDGSLSRGISVLRDETALEQCRRNAPDVMVMEYLDPSLYDEFTCDAYYNRRSKLCCVVPRRRIEVRGGEISKGKTEKNEIVELFSEKLTTIDGARGCITFQFFIHRENRKVFLIEVNARFGGGFPLALAAGAKYPEWLVQEYLLGRDVAPFDAWIEGLTMLRYDHEVFFTDAYK